MLTGINLDETHDYIVEGTTFKIKVIPNSVMLKMATSGELEKISIDKMIEILQVGLKSIGPILIEGKERNIEVIDEKIIDLLPMNVLTEVFNQILIINNPSEEEVKN